MGNGAEQKRAYSITENKLCIATVRRGALSDHIITFRTNSPALNPNGNQIQYEEWKPPPPPTTTTGTQQSIDVYL